MGFLNPTFMWFMIGGSIPIIIHLLHRQKYRRVRWAAMEFLLLALKKTQRRMQLENLILLLLRVLIMILLALAISRPLLKEAPEVLAQSDTLHLYVIDNSYSMGYKKAQKSGLDSAKEAALQEFARIRKMTESDKVSVILMSNFPETYLPETNKKTLIQKAIEEIKLSHYGTSALATFQLIETQLAKNHNQLKKITLFTDFQRCGWDPVLPDEVTKLKDLLGKLSKRSDVKISMFDVGSKDVPDNRAIVDLRVDQKVIATRRTTNFSVDVQNWSTSSFPSVVVTLYVDGSALPQKTTQLPANALMSVNFSYEFLEPGPHFVEAAIEADFLDVDDHRFLALDVKDGLRGLLVDGEPGQKRWESETDYLKLALDPSGEGRFFKLDVKTTELFTAEQLEAYDFVVLANVQSLTNDKVEKLEAYVTAGGGLFISLGGKVSAVSWNEFFWKKGEGLLPGKLTEVSGTPPDVEPRQPLRMNHINYDHKLFSVFKKGLQHAPRDLIFYQYYRLEGANREHQIADLDDALASPLFIEKKYGDGKVILFTSTIDGDWNAGVPGRPPYLPVMRSAMEYLSSRPLQSKNLVVGEGIVHVMTADKYQPNFRLETSMEGEITLSPSAPKNEDKFVRVFYPLTRAKKEGEQRAAENEGLKFAGRYALKRTDAKEEEKPVSFFACNLPPRLVSTEELARAEGNLEHIGKDELMQRYPDYKFVLIGDVDSSGGVNLQKDPSHLWKYLLYLLAGFLVIESILAFVFGKAKQ
jgi:hypothetical protein